MQRRALLATGLSMPLWWKKLSAEPVEFGLRSPEDNATANNMLHEDVVNSGTAFLRDLQQRCCAYFVDASDSQTGLIADRGRSDGTGFSDHASSAACGFGLSAFSIAAEEGWLTRGEAMERCRRMLRSLMDVAQHEKGFVYHFVDSRSGLRAMNSEASSIDTALMLAGAMTAAVTFSDDPQIVELADQLYRRVDWRWMLGKNEQLHMGWKPESGMIPHQWDSYSELLILVLMAIGAPENAVPGHCWNAWRREPLLEFQGKQFLSYPPLFVHQYPMAFYDFRSYRSPSGRSYWDNAVVAHHAQIDYMTQLGKHSPKQFGHYGKNMWGLTSSDSASGYRDWGGPYKPGCYKPDRGIDGTIVPSAAGGALAILPSESIHTLRYQHQAFGDQVYGRYGFVNAYNPASGWVGTDVIGIDTGITLLMAQNRSNNGVMNTFMQHPAATRAMRLAGFSKPVI